MRETELEGEGKQARKKERRKKPYPDGRGIDQSILPAGGGKSNLRYGGI